MVRRVVGSCPSQFDYISRCLASVRLRTFNGIQARWDAPYAIWEAPKGLDAAYPASIHATITCLHKRSSLVRVDKAGRGRRGGGARDEVIMYSGGYDRHYVCSDDASCDQIYLTAELIADCGQEVFGSAHVELREDCLFLRDPVVRRAAEAYVARGHDLNLPPTRLEMNARAILIGLHLVSRYSNCAKAREIRKHGLSTRQLTAVLDRIEGSLDGEVRVSDLAVEAGLGVRQFFAAFQVSTGTTPHAYLLERRLHRARSLLSVKASLAEIALDCGFASQQHFSTAFRKAFGMSPSAWRRALGGSAAAPCDQVQFPSLDSSDVWRLREH